MKLGTLTNAQAKNLVVTQSWKYTLAGAGSKNYMVDEIINSTSFYN
ncbi:MAG: hypothetical protein ABL940_13935 [Bacteroidia bacterium]